MNTFVGNLTKDPELRFTPNGAAVCNFTIAVSDRVKNAEGQWVDGEPMFIRCAVWKEAAEHVAESLSRGNRVIVTGTLKQKSYEANGQTKSSLELNVDEVGASLRFSQVKVAAREAKQQQPARDAWGQSEIEAPF